MLRVTSGTAKGKKLKTPNIPEFRAAQDKVKLAVFSILDEKIIGANCLDLYAGSGSFGIEALSRGARHCDFVETTRTGEVTIEENLATCELSGKAEVFKQDVIKHVANTVERYDVIFADPFFNEIHHRFLFQNMEEILNDGGVIVFSHGKETDIKDALTNTQNLEVYDTRKYGNAFISIFKKN